MYRQKKRQTIEDVENGFQAVAEEKPPASHEGRNNYSELHALE